MKKLNINRIFTIKFIVGFSLIVSLLSMSTILGIGYAQIRSASSQSIDENNVTAGDKTVETAVQVAGGEDGTPTITIKTTPDKIAPGDSATIDWEAKNADTCTASGAWSGIKNSVGNQNTGALQDSQKYSLTCVNASGSTSVNTTVTVDPSLGVLNTSESTSTNSVSNSTNNNDSAPNPIPSSSPAPSGATNVAPVLTLSISSGSISAGSSANISWSVNGNASPTPTCSASESWTGGKATSGSQNVSPSAGTYTYTLTCSNSAGSSNKSVSLTVNAVSGCGSGGSCSLSDVSSHNTQSNCWVIIKYTSSGGNGTNGQVYQITSGFFGGSGSHNSLPSAPSLTAGSWCGKNISSTFSSKHNNGSVSDGTHNAIWWLTSNGNSLIGPYSGS